MGFIVERGRRPPRCLKAPVTRNVMSPEIEEPSCTPASRRCDSGRPANCLPGHGPAVRHRPCSRWPSKIIAVSAPRPAPRGGSRPALPLASTAAAGLPFPALGKVGPRWVRPVSPPRLPRGSTMIGKKTLLRCFVGTLTCVAVVVSGWDAEAGHRRRCRRACCCPTTCCVPACDPCCVTTCAPVCDPCCTTTCSNGCCTTSCSNGACTTTYMNGCCYNSCCYTTVTAPVICCVADAASSPSTAAVASKSSPPATKAAKAVPVSTGSAADGR